jgi:O-antigen/teichoic acid export membrane protein
MIKKLLNNTFLQGSVIVTGASFLVSIINYLFNLAVAHGVSVANYGEYFSVMAYIVVLTIPCGALGSILIRRIGQVNSEDRAVFAQHVEAWLLRKTLRYSPLILIASGIFYWLLVEKSNLQPFSVLFILLMTGLTVLQMFYLSALQAHKAFVLYGIYLAGAAILRLVGGAGAVFLTGQVPVLFFILLLVMLAQVIAGHFVIHRSKSTRKISFEFQKIRQYLLRPTIILPLLTTLGVIGISNMDVILVKKFMSESDAGIYSAFSLLSKIIFFVAGPIGTVGYIFFTGKEHKAGAQKLLLVITAITAFIGVSAIVFYTLFAHFAIKFFFDQRFLGFSSSLWLGAVYGTLYSLVILYAQYFMAKNSLVSILSVLGLVGQIIGISIFHSSLENVMMVNIWTTFVLLIAYLISFAVQWKSQSIMMNHGHTKRTLH